MRLLGQAPEKHRRQLFQRIGVQFQEGNYHPEIKVSELCEETASLYRSPADWRKLCQQFGIGGKCGAGIGGGHTGDGSDIKITGGKKSLRRRAAAALHRAGAAPPAGAGISG